MSATPIEGAGDVWSGIGAASGIAALLVTCVVSAQLRRSAIAHLRAHLELIKDWTHGNYGRGWTVTQLRPWDRLRWMLPDQQVFVQSSAPAIHQLPLTQGIFPPVATSKSPTCGRVKLLHPVGGGTVGS